jgi:hypothetical protein
VKINEVRVGQLVEGDAYRGVWIVTEISKQTVTIRPLSRPDSGGITTSPQFIHPTQSRSTT